MSKSKTQKELLVHKDKALAKLNSYLTALIDSSDFKFKGKADKLCYWLEDWTTFLDFEPEFNPASLRRYKRGEIIKAHLGFNVGSEEGGLHYAVVLDRENGKHSPVITVVPLTSVKPKTDLNKLKKGNIFLGNELFTSLSSKISSSSKYLSEQFNFFNALVNDSPKVLSSDELIELNEKIESTEEELELLDRMRHEILRMKTGSIALTGQITTISKIRIYDPKTDLDILSGMKLSNEKLDLIDAEMKKLFIHNA